MATPKTIAIILAGGTGTRMGLGYNKVFAELFGRSILAHSIFAFEKNPAINEIVVAVGNPAAVDVAQEISQVQSIIKAEHFKKVTAIVPGGLTRMDSVESALQAAAPSDDDVVLVHDGARPLVTQQIIHAVLESVEAQGAAVCGVAPNDTIVSVGARGRINRVPKRSDQWALHTPMGARYGLMRQARAKARAEGYIDAPGFEDAALLWRAGTPVQLVASEPENIKITNPLDLTLAGAILSLRKKDL